jgi:hypothetical protein
MVSVFVGVMPWLNATAPGIIAAQVSNAIPYFGHEAGLVLAKAMHSPVMFGPQ